MRTIRIDCAGGIDLSSTFNCGQAFRWNVFGEGYIGEIDGMAMYIKESGGGIEISTDACEDLALSAARKYFDADRDYLAVSKEYADEPWISAAFSAYPGLRVLRQPAFETVITFIVSANNNTGRITKIVRRMAEELGEKIEWDGGEAVYTFPSPQALSAASEERLRAMGVGYRAPFILESARMIEAGFSLNLEGFDYENAHKQLLSLPGVGDKVADCILLFSFGYMRAIPVDVWVERVLQSGFFPDVKGRKALKRAAMERFGECGGIAQQVLFHAARNGTLPL